MAESIGTRIGECSRSDLFIGQILTVAGKPFTVVRLVLDLVRRQLFRADVHLGDRKAVLSGIVRLQSVVVVSPLLSIALVTANLHGITVPEIQIVTEIASLHIHIVLGFFIFRNEARLQGYGTLRGDRDLLEFSSQSHITNSSYA